MNVMDCSTCLEEVIDNNVRSIAKLKCGHVFHLDCIGSEFNVRGLMVCPNCRDVENGNWLFLEYENPYGQYVEEVETILMSEPEPVAESYFGLAPEMEACIAGALSPIISAIGEPVQIPQHLQPIQNAANVNEIVELSFTSPIVSAIEEPIQIPQQLQPIQNAANDDETVELSFALTIGPMLAPPRNGPVPQPSEQAVVINLELPLALRNGQVAQQIEQAAGMDLELSLSLRNGPAPPPNDQAEGNNLELSLAPNSIYVERYFLSQNMDVDDPMGEAMLDSNEEEDDEIHRPNMI